MGCTRVWYVEIDVNEKIRCETKKTQKKKKKGKEKKMRAEEKKM